MRRAFLVAFFVAPLFACGSSLDEPAPVTDGGTPDAVVAKDAQPDTSADAAPPVPIPIKHVVVVVKENHTFDNYFGSFPNAEGALKAKTTSGMITPPHAPDRTPRDLCHQHSCALTDWNGGAMDGWDNVAGTSTNGDNLAYAQYQESDIPNYWQYARHFTLGDHFFANVLGPSFPGHTFVLAAQSGWAYGNPNTQLTHPYWGCDQAQGTLVSIEDESTCSEKQVFPCFKIPSIPDVLPAGVDWKFYGSNFYLLPEVWSMFDAIDGIRNGPGWSHIVKEADFDAAIDAKTLPAVTFLVDQDLADEHPNVGGVCDGENWTVGHLNKIMQSDYWKDTVILFTMDDFGGWYDHVPPPRQYGCDKTKPYGLGFRLPLIVISPYAKEGYILKDVAEQASIPRFIEKVFGATKTLSDLDPAAQDGQANDLMNAFDFTQKPLPPLVLQKRT
ncbi:MAG TPA: alkaline phosphatase family protein, partial [Polyangiaceae bacterium]